MAGHFLRRAGVNSWGCEGGRSPPAPHHRFPSSTIHAVERGKKNPSPPPVFATTPHGKKKTLLLPRICRSTTRRAHDRTTRGIWIPAEEQKPTTRVRVAILFYCFDPRGEAMFYRHDSF